MKECIFCSLVAKEIPSYMVYEDDDVYAFLDINPVKPGHTLVVPKLHSMNVWEIAEGPFLNTLRIVQKLVPSIKRAMQAEGVNICQNNGVAAGQSVPHFHVHIIPRHHHDGLKPWPETTYASSQEAVATAKKISAEL